MIFMKIHLGGTIMAELTQKGFLKISVTTAGTAIPLSGALVTIFCKENGQTILLHTAQTDSSGQTLPFSLAAPPKSYAESPGNPKPYELYYVEIIKDGYVPTEKYSVPIFSGIQSILPVELIPSGIENQPPAYLSPAGNQPNL